ncbi:MAG: hypothetical protein ABIO24_02840 [Saprospiraceae bacterium]
MAERLSADKVVRLAAQAGRTAYQEGLRAGFPVVTLDESIGKTYLKENGRKFEVEMRNGEVGF